MSTNKTDFLNMNDWVGTDQFRREELNANFRALDAKTKEHDDSIGDLTALGTTEKGNLVGAVNEVTTSLAQSAKQTDVNKFASQADYVDLIKNRRSYNRMRLQKIPTVAPFVGCFSLVLDDGGKHTTYNFTRDTDDDFIKINNCYVGNIGEVTTGYDDGTKTGTWAGTSPHLFTQQVGATITGSVKGSIIKFNRRMNDVGGIWEIVVDGDTANKVTVSCWNATDIGCQQIVVKTGLDRNVSHTVVATFKGDDPAHVPTSGAGTGRGYANITNDSFYTGNGLTPIQGFITAYIPDGNLANANYLLDQSSNKEFAFNMTYGSWTNWVPEHNLTPVIYQIEAPVYKLDGVSFDLSTLNVNQYKDCSDFKLIQHLYVKANGTNIAEIRFIHHIDKSGVLSITGNIKALFDITMNNMYPLMLPSKQGVLNEVITGLGNTKTSINDGSIYYFTEELDMTKSMALISSSFPDYIAAGTVENQYKTMRVGKSKGSLPVNNSMRYWQQANAPKAYWNPVQNIVFPTGSSYSWFGKIAIGEIENIYNYVKSDF